MRRLNGFLPRLGLTAALFFVATSEQAMAQHGRRGVHAGGVHGGYVHSAPHLSGGQVNALRGGGYHAPAVTYHSRGGAYRGGPYYGGYRGGWYSRYYPYYGYGLGYPYYGYGSNFPSYTYGYYGYPYYGY